MVARQAAGALRRVWGMQRAGHVVPSIVTFLFVVKLIGSLEPTFKPLTISILPLTTKSLAIIFIEFITNWSDDMPIVVVTAPPIGANRLISRSCSNDKYDFPLPKPTCIKTIEPSVFLFLINIFLLISNDESL